jgi:hypothetical protein
MALISATFVKFWQVFGVRLEKQSWDIFWHKSSFVRSRKRQIFATIFSAKIVLKTFA